MRKKYKKDFLKRVIARIDFDRPLNINFNNPPNEIYLPVKSRFPITQENKSIGREFIIGPKSSFQREVETPEWYFHGENRNKYLKITPDYLLVEYKKYEYYEQLKEDFLAVSNQLFDNNINLKAKRLGLRYIDEIELSENNPLQWDRYLDTNLNSILYLIDDKEFLSRTFNILEFNYGDSNMRFQYGMLNSDYPARIKKKSYTLDFDMYTNNILDKNEVGERLDKFHLKLSSTFEQVIKNDLRKKMGIIKNE